MKIRTIVIISLLFASFSAFYMHKMAVNRYKNRPWDVTGMSDSVTLPLDSGRSITYEYSYSVRDCEHMNGDYWVQEGVVSAFYDARSKCSHYDSAFKDSINSILPRYRSADNISEIRIDSILKISIVNVVK